MELKIKNTREGYSFDWGEGWQNWQIDDLIQWAAENNEMLHMFLIGDLPLEVCTPGKDGELIFRLQGGIN